MYWKWQRFRSKFQFSEPVEFCSSDILLLPDGYWSLNEIWPAVEEAKQTGAWVTCLVYDIICLTHPHFFPEKPVTAFRNYLQEVQQKADLILTISHTVRQQLETYRHAEMADCAHPEIRVFRLGADRLEIQGIVRPELEIAFQSAVQPYVMVATLEPRKNHHFVLDAFESLWHRGGDQKLVLAGKVGWSCDALLSRLQRHPELGRKIFVFHDLSDREIGYCYQHSSGAISASVTEGFGLPIVEALQYGKPVFASDIDVHREAGGQSCHYFSLRSADCLADMVTNFENRREHRAQSTAVDENTSWEASTTEFLQIVVEQWAVDHLKDGDSHVAQRLPHGAGRKSIEQCDSPRDRKLAKVSTRR